MEKLKGKKVLLIMPLFFGYETEIKKSLEKQGASVSMIYENINDIYMSYKVVYRYIKPLQKFVTHRYYKKHLNASEKKYDYVLVIRGFSLSEEILTMIKAEAAENCRYVLYLWDSIKRVQNPLLIAHMFDKVYTFDHEDAKIYGWEYHPTFYIDALADEKCEKDIDIAFVCSMHSQRYQILKTIESFSKNMGLNLYSHLYLNRLIFFKYKYLDRKPLFVQMGKRELKHNMLSLEETYALYRRSKIVVDFTNPEQTGFTQRTFESMGNGCKLITSNPFVRELDFYNEKNILVYEGADIRIPEWFIEEPYDRPKEEIYRKYSLTEWIMDIVYG